MGFCVVFYGCFDVCGVVVVIRFGVVESGGRIRVYFVEKKRSVYVFFLCLEWMFRVKK